MLVNYYKKTGNVSEKTSKTIRLMLIPMGLFLLAAGKAVSRFFPENGTMAFISGMLMGLSVVANIAGIIACRHYLKK